MGIEGNSLHKGASYGEMHDVGEDLKTQSSQIGSMPFKVYTLSLNMISKER